MSWVSSKIDSETPRLPSGARFAARLIPSPSPGLFWTATLVCRISKLATASSVTSARTRVVASGWIRPWRESSARVHISLTGLPSFCEISAASSEASKVSLRPKDPPPSGTWKVTAFCSMPRSLATSDCAAIGFLQGLQISALPSRTSAIAPLGSSDEPLRG